jgi:hypothetical protein
MNYHERIITNSKSTFQMLLIIKSIVKSGLYVKKNGPNIWNDKKENIVV